MAIQIARNDRSCFECAFYAGLVDNTNGEGACVRHAPRPYLVRGDEDHRSEEYASWPIVADDDWCGEFVRNPNVGPSKE
jgi:hypothetical protein